MFEIGDRVKVIPGSETDIRYHLHGASGTITEIDPVDDISTYRVCWGSNPEDFHVLWVYTVDIRRETPLDNREATLELNQY